MIDIFFCTMDDKDPMRTQMSILCQERWKLEKNIKLMRITPSIIGCAPEEFQRERRIYADKHADSPIYVCADDDCLLGNESPIGYMIQMMERHPDFQILSTLPANATIGLWTPEDYTPTITADIWEHVSVGQVRFCRKPVLEMWPPQIRKGYDNEQCARIRAEGKRSGYAIHVKHNHLGENHTTTWR